MHYPSHRVSLILLIFTLRESCSIPISSTGWLPIAKDRSKIEASRRIGTTRFPLKILLLFHGNEPGNETRPGQPGDPRRMQGNENQAGLRCYTILTPSVHVLHSASLLRAVPPVKQDRRIGEKIATIRRQMEWNERWNRSALFLVIARRKSISGDGQGSKKRKKSFQRNLRSSMRGFPMVSRTFVVPMVVLEMRIGCCWMEKGVNGTIFLVYCKSDRWRFG